MLYRLLFILLLGSLSLHAQAAKFRLLDAATATGASRSIDNGTSVHQGWILAVYTTGAPTGCTIALQESDDDGVADAYASVTATAGSSNPFTCTTTGRVVYFGFSRYLRANLTALSGGTSPAVTAYLIAPTPIQMASILDVTQGGTGTGTAFTAGSVIFAGTGGTFSQDNANFFWDDTNNTVGLGAAPVVNRRLHVSAGGTGDNSSAISAAGTVTANANNQSLDGILVTNLTFGKSTFTGLEAAGLEVRGGGMLATGSGTIANAYSIFASPPIGIGTNNYALYTSGGFSVIGGSLAVGNTTDPGTGKLRVLDGIGIGANPSTGEVRNEGSASPAFVAQGATNPQFRTLDSTNTLITKVQSLDSSGFIGTESNHPVDFIVNNAAKGRISTAGLWTLDAYGSTVNCADGTASPADCTSAPAGGVIISAAATTVTVNTTAVTANSQIFVQEDSSLGTRLSVTCNTTTGRTYTVTARTAATSFVITASAAPTTNPACLNYFIMN